jgi:hypothetical protein
MRRIIIVALSAVLLTTAVLVVRGAAAGSTRSAAATAPATISEQAGQRKALYQSQLEQSLQHQHQAAHQHPAAAPNGGGGRGQVLASRLAAARLATARYATSLRAAKADGYQIITRMIPTWTTTSSTRPSSISLDQPWPVATSYNLGDWGSEEQRGYGDLPRSRSRFPPVAVERRGPRLALFVGVASSVEEELGKQIQVPPARIGESEELA